MSNDITNLMSSYWSWMQDRITVRQIGDWIEITTPYLDRHNDYLHVYAKVESGRITLTDDAYTMNDLRLSGLDLSYKRRQKTLESIINGFDVKINGNTLITTATTENFARKLHDIIQAMLSVGDLIFVSQTSERGAFQEHIGLWLTMSRIPFEDNIQLKGKSGNTRTIHYVIPPTENRPVSFVQTIKQPDSRSVNNFTFIWLDVRETQNQDARAYAFLNDLERKPGREAYNTLETYQITPLLWSKREIAYNELAG